MSGQQEVARWVGSSSAMARWVRSRRWPGGWAVVVLLQQ